ncbi:MAG: LLM class flavin-dependent oxidoreductase [Candidatus Hodarchaeota archaeon]
MSSDFKFGVILIQELLYDEMVRVSQKIEAMGWDSLWVADEFQPSIDWLECWTLLGGLAEATSSIRIGSLVSPIPIRHPALLAKMAITVDHISDGRLELGIGTGVSGDRDSVYRMTGLEDWKPRERVNRFKEQTEIIDLLLRENVVSYSGKYYHLDRCELRPRPVQKPRPPITIGAMGPRMLKITAKFADRWSSHGESWMSLEEAITIIDKRMHLLDQYCDEVGRNPKSLTRSILTYGKYGDNSFSSVDRFEEITNRYRELGINELIYYYPAQDRSQQKIFEKIAREKIPELR